MNPTELRTIIAQIPTFVLKVEVTQPFKALPQSEKLVGKRFVILNAVDTNGPYAVIHQLENDEMKVGEYATNYPIKGLKFLHYARLYNDSNDPAMYKNLRVGELRD